MAKSSPALDSEPRHITCIEVRKLFGHLDYDISTFSETAQNDLLIIYGENGSGKTTLLRLLFNTLSTMPGAGRKTYLAQTPFEKLAISFSGGSSVTVDKHGKLTGGYTVTIVDPSGKLEKFVVKATSEGDLKQGGNPFPELLSCLARLNVSLYFLPDDRRVQADSFDERSEDTRTQRQRIAYRAARLGTTHPDTWIVREWMTEHANSSESTESHHLEIRPVLATLSGSLRQQAIQGSNTGEESASNIYLGVVERLKSVAWPSEEGTTVPGSDLIQRIEDLSRKIQQFSHFGLHAGFPAEKFIAAFSEASSQEKLAIRQVLEPYLGGLEARLSALQELYDIISTYVETLNSFFSNKTLSLDIRRGIIVTSHWGETIDPSFLSSGERQLLLLLTNTILARKKSSIFIIDEPELSLNVTWQRRLVSALLKCSRGGGIQYILASHSLELITQYQDRTTRLMMPRVTGHHG